MIESKNDTSKNLEKALQALKQAQQRVANEKKKQNEKKRKAGKPLPHPMRSKSMQTGPLYGTLLNCQRKGRNHMPVNPTQKRLG